MTKISSLLDWIFPSACLSCNAWLSRGAVCCEACFRNLPRFSTLFCGTCRARLPEGKKLCHKDFPYLLGAATDYRDPGVSALIRSLKFDANRAAGEPLGILLATYARAVPLPSDAMIIPIPLSPSRLRERGFNQAEILGRPLARALAIPFLGAAIQRVRHTKPQSEIGNAEERTANVSGCFYIPDPSVIAGKNIILVDDVVTSGATLLEAARTLRSAGARRVIALAAAKA